MIPYSQLKNFQTGDILVTSSFVPFIQHFAVFYLDEQGNPTVADNSFLSKRVDVLGLEEYKKKRNILGVIRNDNTMNLTDEYIRKKVEDAKKINYKFFDFNCEDFVKSVCGCHIGMDQRIKYLLIFFFVLLFIIILIKAKQ